MKSVLIVDDEISARRPLKLILKDLGFEDIDEASDGDEGVEKYKEIEPDLVLMDVIMPNMNGLEATKKMIDHDPDAEIIVLTAANQEEIKDKFIDIGIEDYITKPYSQDEVEEAIKKVN